MTTSEDGLFAAFSVAVNELAAEYWKREAAADTEAAADKFAINQQAAIHRLIDCNEKNKAEFMSAYMALLSTYTAFLLIQFFQPWEGKIRVEFLPRYNRGKRTEDSSGGRGDPNLPA